MSDKVREVYGRKLREWLNAEGRRVNWLSGSLEVAPETASRWVVGRNLPSAEHQARISDLTAGFVLPVAEVYREAVEGRR